MRDAVIVHRDPVLVCERVDERSGGGVADDLVCAVVLHHHVEDMLKMTVRVLVTDAERLWRLRRGWCRIETAADDQRRTEDPPEICVSHDSLLVCLV